MIDGTLDIQDTELFRGLARRRYGQQANRRGRGGGVLVNPCATLNVTICEFKSNAASGTATSDRDGGHNAAGGGIYAAAGSFLNITGLTSFVNNRLIAGHGASAVGTGGDGGSAFGAGVAMNAPVSGESNTTGLAGELTLTSNDTGAAQFTGGRINTEILGTGAAKTVGGTGGTGSQTGGPGGNAYGGGLYIGAGTIATPQQPGLVLSGAASIDFSDNQIIGGEANSNGDPAHEGLGGIAYGAVRLHRAGINLRDERPDVQRDLHIQRQHRNLVHGRLLRYNSRDDHSERWAGSAVRQSQLGCHGRRDALELAQRGVGRESAGRNGDGNPVEHGTAACHIGLRRAIFEHRVVRILHR